MLTARRALSRSYMIAFKYNPYRTGVEQKMNAKSENPPPPRKWVKLSGIHWMWIVEEGCMPQAYFLTYTLQDLAVQASIFPFGCQIALEMGIFAGRLGTDLARANFVGISHTSKTPQTVLSKLNVLITKLRTILLHVWKFFFLVGTP